MLDPKIREKLDGIEIFYVNGKRKIRCFCGENLNTTIVPHLRKEHSNQWENWCESFVSLRNRGLLPYQIIHQFKTKDDRFLFTSSVVQREIKKLVEQGKVKLQIYRKEKIDCWNPKNLDITRKTLWTFKNRGSWAVHRGDYRGNWAPQIPRTLINLYSKEEDVVLDPFVGGGTTLIETWLTNRKGIGIDISPIAIATTESRIQEMSEHAQSDPRIHLREDLRPIIIAGDSRNLQDHMRRLAIDENSIGLVCAHPPYLNSLKYTDAIDEDLSRISDPLEFCDQLQLIAKQILRFMSDNGTCAVLIGDLRKNKKIIPLGFKVMQTFLKEDFRLKEIIIKAQHNDSSTRFWYTKKNHIDFLIAHEYLFIFGK